MVGEHLKNRKTVKSKRSAIDFIESAESDYKALEASQTPSPKNILLSFSGRIDREKECEKKGFLLYLKKDTAADISKYCHGSMQGVLNYLVRRGLDSLVEEGELKLILE